MSANDVEASPLLHGQLQLAGDQAPLWAPDSTAGSTTFGFPALDMGVIEFRWSFCSKLLRGSIVDYNVY